MQYVKRFPEKTAQVNECAEMYFHVDHILTHLDEIITRQEKVVHCVRHIILMCARSESRDGSFQPRRVRYFFAL